MGQDKKYITYDLWTITDQNNLIPSSELCDKIMYCVLTSFFIKPNQELNCSIKALKGDPWTDFQKQLISGRNDSDGNLLVGYSNENEFLILHGLSRYIFTENLTYVVHLVITQGTNISSVIGFQHVIKKDDHVETRHHWIKLDLHKLRDKFVKTDMRSFDVIPHFIIPQVDLCELICGENFGVVECKSDTIFVKDRLSSPIHLEYPFTFKNFNFSGMDYFSSYSSKGVSLTKGKIDNNIVPTICFKGVVGPQHHVDMLKSDFLNYVLDVFSIEDVEYNLLTAYQLNIIMKEIKCNELKSYIEYTDSVITGYRHRITESVILIIEYIDKNNNKTIIGGPLLHTHLGYHSLRIQKNYIKYVDKTKKIPCLKIQSSQSGNSVLKWLSS
ncbi:hypothetical protein [Salmon gill poxvirus]